MRVETFLEDLKRSVYDTQVSTKVFFLPYLLIAIGIDLLLFAILTIKDLFEVKQYEVESSNIYFLFVLGVFILPILEELVFRLPADKKLKSIPVMLSGMAITYLLADNSNLVLFVFAFFSLVIMLYYLNTLAFQTTIILGSISFSFLHLGQYDLTESPVDHIVIPVFLFSKFVPSLFMYLLRRHGINWSIGLHSLNNLVVFMAIFLTNHY